MTFYAIIAMDTSLTVYSFERIRKLTVVVFFTKFRGWACKDLAKRSYEYEEQLLREVKNLLGIVQESLIGKLINEEYPIETADIMSKASKETNKPVQALFNAVASSKLRLVRLLIEGGVHVDSRNDHGQTPLLITCSSLNNTCHARGETRGKVVKYLISVGADVNIYDISGRTPLIYAVITRASVIFDLLDAGADPWKEDGSHKCAFDYALQNKDIVQVEIMVDAYKRKRIRGIVRDVGDTRGIAHDNGETRNTRDSGETRNTRDVTDTVHSKNRKRLAKSRNIGIPNLTFRKNSINTSSENSKRASLPQVTPAHYLTTDKRGVESFFKGPPLATSSNPCDPREPTSNNSTNPPNIPQIHENSLLCDLCKSIFSEQLQNEAEILNPSFAEDFNFTENDLSGLLFRRRSTGCLFALKGKSHDFYESIRQKRELGMTMEDLFSNTEINQPEKHHLSANELLLPDRTRSASVCLPLLNNTRRDVEDRMFFSPDAFPFITSAKSVPQLHTIAWSRPGSPDLTVTPESSVYLGSDDECDGVIPTSCRSFTSSHIFDMTSSPLRSMTSSPILDMTSSPIRSRTSSPVRNMTSSPIPDLTSSPIQSRTSSLIRSMTSCMTSSPILDMTSSPLRSRTSLPIRSMMSSPIRSMTSSSDYDCPSQRDMMSLYREPRPSSAFCDNDSVACNSLIPTIVLTDCVNTNEM